MIVLSPITIGAEMFLSGSVPEVDTDAGEVAWSASPVAAIGDERVYNRRVWKCTLVPPDPAKTPDKDPKSWQDMRPSNRWAPFDKYISTKQVGRKGQVDYVIKPGFFNGLALEGLKGSRLQISIKDGPLPTDADLIEPVDVSLRVRSAGWRSYWFGRKLQITKHRLDKLPLNPSAVIRVTVLDAVDADVGIGFFNIGDWINFGVASRGLESGAMYGARAEMVNFSYRKDNDDGTYELLPRGSAVNVSIPVIVDANEANRLFDVVRRLANTPVSVYASTRDRDRFLSTVGLVSTDFTREITDFTNLNVYVKGVLQ